MGLKDDLLAAAKRTAGRAGNQVAAGLNRADELGGELRDYLLAQEDKPTLRKLGERMARLSGEAVDDGESGPSKYEQAVASAADAAPPPTAAEVSAIKERKGLGDPEIAAQVYGRESCPWTGRAITLLNEGKVDFDFVDLDDPDSRQLEGPLTAETKQNTVPYVYLRGEFVGGYNELNEVVRLGQLDFRILSAEGKQAAGPQKIGIAPRERSGGAAPGELEDPPEARE